jgi:hypothetical protein
VIGNFLFIQHTCIIFILGLAAICFIGLFIEEIFDKINKKRGGLIMPFVKMNVKGKVKDKCDKKPKFKIEWKKLMKKRSILYYQYKHAKKFRARKKALTRIRKII